MRRQSNVFAATAMAAAISGAVTVSAQPSPQAQAAPATPQLAPGLSTKPYSRLFAQRVLEPRASRRSNDVRPNSARRFCTMPVLPSDPAIDPKFETQLHDTRTRFSMRVVDPGQCP
jgi:hypothetical protein